MAKKKKNPSKPNNIYKTYEVQGDKLVRKNKSCPKCGPGYALAAHKDRRSCGKCGFMEKV